MRENETKKTEKFAWASKRPPRTGQIACNLGVALTLFCRKVSLFLSDSCLAICVFRAALARQTHAHGTPAGSHQVSPPAAIKIGRIGADAATQRRATCISAFFTNTKVSLWRHDGARCAEIARARAADTPCHAVINLRGRYRHARYATNSERPSPGRPVRASPLATQAASAVSYG